MEACKSERTRLKAKRKLEKTNRCSGTGIPEKSVDSIDSLDKSEAEESTKMCMQNETESESICSLMASLKSFQDLNIKETEEPSHVLTLFKQGMLQISSVLIQQQKVNVEKQQEIDLLKKEISSLKCQVKDLQEWQRIAYNELQKANSNIQYYSNYILSKQITLKSDNSKTKNGKYKSKESQMKSSEPIFYGGSTKSKKIIERKRLNKNQSTDFSGNKTFEHDQKTSLDDVTSNFYEDMITSNTELHQDKVKASDANIILSPEDVVSEESKMDSVESVQTKNKESVAHNNDESLKPQIKGTTGVVNNETNKNETESIADTLRKTAESAVSNSGFIFDSSSGLYYDWNLKMYYDPSTQLYYDHQNGVYYYYDNEKNTFLFHSQVSVSKSEDTLKEETDSILSEGEIESNESDEEVHVYPCIRAIVLESTCLDIGSLFIITTQGTSIGRGADNKITIEEDSVSNCHAEVVFCSKDKTFYINNKSSSTIFINEEAFEYDPQNADPVEILHKDIMKFGDTVLSFHVHLGLETCNDCEPGNIKALLLKEEEEIKQTIESDLNTQRKAELKQLRKKYNIKPGYIPKKLIESIPDRAEERRKTVGSQPYENEYRPTEKASIHKEIPKENKGHKMLAKMGWKSGEGLGKTKSGIVAPVSVDVLQKNKGLGTGNKSNIQTPKLKPDKWDKARERFNKL